MPHEIPELDTPGLRNAALKTGAVVGGLFGLLLPWLFGLDYPAWPWITAGVLLLWGLLAPASLGPVYRLWMKFGAALGWVNSRIILSLMFYLMIFPVGLFMRMLGKDPLMRRLESNKPSYRITSKVQPGKQMEKPY